MVASLLAQETPAPPDAPAPQTEYGGPAILSRGAASTLRTPGNVRLRPYLAVTGTYDTGITPVSIRSDGGVPNVASPGAEGEVGVLGYRQFKKSSLGLDYRGNYRHYTKSTYYNGTDQVLA